MTRTGSRAARVLRRTGAAMAIALAAACASDVTPPYTPFEIEVHRPTVPIPDSLWRAPAGSTPATHSYLYLEMDTLSAGVTSPRTIMSPSETISATAARHHLVVTAADTIAKLSMSGTFDAMLGMLTLERGYYPDLHGLTALPRDGAMDVALNARPCVSPSGWFAIDTVFYFNGNMTMLDLRFEERCAGVAAPMHGQVHWRE